MRSDWDRRARENAQHFIACGHSESDEVFWASGLRDLDQLVLHDVELDSTARALEIGCGMGRILKPLSERIEKAFGVDISAEMIARARQGLAGLGNVEVFVTRGRLSDFEDASLDFVYSFIVFQHIPPARGEALWLIALFAASIGMAPRLEPAQSEGQAGERDSWPARRGVKSVPLCDILPGQLCPPRSSASARSAAET